MKRRRPAEDQRIQFEDFKARTGLPLFGGPVPSTSEEENPKRTGLRVFGGPVSLPSEKSRENNDRSLHFQWTGPKSKIEGNSERTGLRKTRGPVPSLKPIL